MLAATQYALRKFDNNEFVIYVIVGKNGVGKTAYGNRVLAEIYSIRERERYWGDGEHANWNITLFKRHMGYHPEEVKRLWDRMKRREIAFHWDDAGVWLSAYEHYDQYVQSIAKYLQTARTDFGCLMFSCIDKDDIISKIRNFRSTIIIEITKHENQPNSPYDSERFLRKATAWHYWSDRFNKVGTENDWEESFNCKMPGNFSEKNPKWIRNPNKADMTDPNVTWGFYGWYQKRRIKYARLAKKLASKKLEEKKKKGDL